MRLEPDRPRLDAASCPRPSTLRALDARLASRCSRSSDSVPAGCTVASAGGLFAAPAFFAWARVVGLDLHLQWLEQDLQLTVQEQEPSKQRTPYNYRESTFPRLWTTSQAKVQACARKVSTTATIVGTCRTSAACSGGPQCELPSPIQIAGSRVEQYQPCNGRAKRCGYASEVSLENSKRSDRMAPGTLVVYIQFGKIKCCIFEFRSNTSIRQW